MVITIPNIRVTIKRTVFLNLIVILLNIVVLYCCYIIRINSVNVLREVLKNYDPKGRVRLAGVNVVINKNCKTLIVKPGIAPGVYASC